jgi:hypothetical protein
VTALPRPGGTSTGIDTARRPRQTKNEPFDDPSRVPSVVAPDHLPAMFTPAGATSHRRCRGTASRAGPASGAVSASCTPPCIPCAASIRRSACRRRTTAEPPCFEMACPGTTDRMRPSDRCPRPRSAAVRILVQRGISRRETCKADRSTHRDPVQQSPACPAVLRSDSAVSKFPGWPAHAATRAVSGVPPHEPRGSHSCERDHSMQHDGVLTDARILGLAHRWLGQPYAEQRHP